MKKAFTLAEVIIALLVFGVLIGFLAPMMSKITPNKDQYYFLKIYFSLEQAVAKMVNNNGLYDEYSNSVLESPTNAGGDDILTYFCKNLRRELMVQPGGGCNLTFKTGQTATVVKASDGFIVEIPFWGKETTKPSHKIYISSQGRFTVDEESEEAKYLNEETNEKED